MAEDNVLQTQMCPADRLLFEKMCEKMEEANELLENIACSFKPKESEPVKEFVAEGEVKEITAVTVGEAVIQLAEPVVFTANPASAAELDEAKDQITKAIESTGATALVKISQVEAVTKFAVKTNAVVKSLTTSSGELAFTEAAASKEAG